MKHGYFIVVTLGNDEQNPPTLSQMMRRGSLESRPNTKDRDKENVVRKGRGPSICEHGFGGTQIYGPSFFLPHPFRLN